MVRVNQPESRPMRIAIILGPGSASRYLLDQLRPLLATDQNIELQGMFLEEAGVRNAAELPFVKELCRVTFAVREFNSVQFERALALRMRTARKALAVIAGHSGATHSFRNVSGSAVGLLQKAVSESDITVFEPARPRMVSAISTAYTSRHRPRVAALLSDLASGQDVLRTAINLAGGNFGRMAVLLMPDPGVEVKDLRALVHETLPGGPAHVRLIADADFNSIASTLREWLVSMFVVPATDRLTGDEALQFLRAQIRCPVCMVRNWKI